MKLLQNMAREFVNEALLPILLCLFLVSIVAPPIILSNMQDEKEKEALEKAETELHKYGCSVWFVDSPSSKSVWTCPNIEEKFTVRAFQEGKIKLPQLAEVVQGSC